jgi:hypothetical protein
VPQCRAITRDGSRCKASVRPGVEWCYNHDPARSEERRRNASRAGRSKPNREITDLKDQLQEIADNVLDGSADARRAAVAVQALQAKRAVLETERRVRELEEIERRLTALEDVRYREERSAGYGGL